MTPRLVDRSALVEIAWRWAAVVLGWAAVGAGAQAAEPARARLSLHAAAVLSTTDTEDEFPAVAVDKSGAPWVAWVSYDGRQDRVVVRSLRSDGSPRSAPVALTEWGDHWRPAAVADGAGGVWVTWSEQRDGNWDLWASTQSGTGWSSPIRLTREAGTDFSQQLAVDSLGQIWMAWQAVRDGNYEVLLGRLTSEGLTEVMNVSQDPASDWEPSLATDRRGGVWVAWDSYRQGNYDILVRRVTPDETSPVLAVTSAPEYEAHASIAVDSDDRVWLAWDSAGADWGQHGTSVQRLHHQRRAHVRCFTADRTQALVEEVDARWRGELAQFTELPHLRVDREGRVWLVVRHLTDVTPPGKRPNGAPNQPRGIWNPYILCYAGAAWTEPVVLPESNGRNDMRVVSAWDATGDLWLAWAEDGRRVTRAEEPLNHQVHVNRVSCSGESVARAETVGSGAPPGTAGVATQRDRRDQRYRAQHSGRDVVLLFGDTHRHTDISRCSMNYDGSLMDTYRYAIDAAQLDFLAISDHDQDILKHRYDRKQSPLLDYAWWRSQKYCDLFAIEDKFLPIYGYEHGGSYQARGGHKNVMYAQRGGKCIEDDSPEALFRSLAGRDAVVIPHQLADGGSATDWQRWNGDFERVAEIFQARGSYEFLGAPLQAKVERSGHYLWDALERGARVGVIASSDHGLVHRAYAAVFATELSRPAILEALRARHSFGATDTIVLDFQANGRAAGDTVPFAAHVAIEAAVEGTAPLRQVQVVRNGEFVYTTEPGARTCRVRFTDVAPPAKGGYYYVRAEQTNGEWAWSSAVWLAPHAASSSRD